MVVPARIHHEGVSRDLRSGDLSRDYVIRSGMDDLKNPPQRIEKKKTVRKQRR